MRKLALATPIVICALAMGGGGDTPTHAEATILYRDGSTVRVNYFGQLHKPQPLLIKGEHGGSRVSINLAEVRKVVPVDRDVTSANTNGRIIVVNAKGERFTLEKAYIDVRQPFGSSSASLPYVYNDPITGNIKDAKGDKRNVAEIVVGPSKGCLKINPFTRERFPDFFVFDPYTGHRLVWSTDATSGATGQPRATSCQAFVIRKTPVAKRLLVPGAKLELRAKGRASVVISASTDHEGIASFKAPAGAYEATVTFGSLKVRQNVVVDARAALVITLGD